MNRNGIMAIVDDKGREKERYQVVYGARVLVEDGAPVKSNQILLEWDPYTFSILTEVSGVVHFKDLDRRPHHAGAGGRNHRHVAVVVTDSPDEKRSRRSWSGRTGGSRVGRRSATSCRPTLT